MADHHIVERHRVYTRDEAAALMQMTAMEMDDLLEERGLPVIDTGRRRVYLGETLLRAAGAGLAERALDEPPAEVIQPEAAYTDEQAARLLHISLRTLQTIAGKKQIKQTRAGHRVLYLGEELLRFLRASTA